jgi:DNA polymerase-1
MRVTDENIAEIAERIRPTKIRATDSETTGLKIFKHDVMFSFVIAISSTEAFYFDDAFVSRENVIKYIVPLFKQEGVLWFLHNSKFDLHVYKRALACLMGGDIHDTEVVARLIKNDELSYTLDLCAKRAKLKNQKLTDVKDYCLEHGLWEWDIQPGKKNRKKNFFFHKVPKDIIEKYTLADGLTTFELGMWQLEKLKQMDETKKARVASIIPLYNTEKKITRILQEMEEVGVQLNVPYVQRSLALENSKFEAAAARFESESGVPFKDSDKVFVDVFNRYGLTYGLTDKGNPSFKKEFLKPQLESPIVKAILDYRDSFKVAGSYYQTFLHYMDENGVLHANIKQSGAATGRFSVTDPALQTLKKDEEETDDEDALDQETKSQVRRCLVPRPGYIFVSIDYKQMEYRVMLDYAGEMELIKQVMAGVDIHQATADMVGITRKQAKTLNFALLYGTGIEKLSKMLKITTEEAAKLKAKYFAKLPNVERFVKHVIATARNEGRLYNKFGRVYSFLDKNFAYKGPNYIIQGGCSDAMRTAMIGCYELLLGKKSRMLMQIHDELLFEVHVSETHLVEQLKEVMKAAYPHRLLPMDCDVEWSDKSWQELRPWAEYETAA